MPKRYYRFVGRNAPIAEGLKIPYGAVVECVRWFARRKVLVRWNGELVLTMGYLLRKVEDKT